MDEVLKYISESRKNGLSDEIIKDNLIKAGWNEVIVSDSLAKSGSQPHAGDDTKIINEKITNDSSGEIVEKEDVLEKFKILISRGEVTKEELDHIFEETAEKQDSIGKDLFRITKIGVTEILYIIGGLIVFTGVGVFMFLNWTDMNSFARIIATLGLGLTLYFSGLFLSRDKDSEILSQVLFFVASLIIPTGFAVLMNEMGMEMADLGSINILFLIVTTFFFVSYWLLNKILFLFFSIMSSSVLFFSFTQFMLDNLGGDTYFYDFDIYMYRLLVLGISYLFLAYSFSKSQTNYPLSRPFYFFGSAIIPGSVFGLMFENAFYELLMPFLTGGMMFYSTKLKSKALLWFGSLYLMSYIIRISSKYFADSIGWPVILIISGLAIIGVGYFSYSLNKKYIK